MSSRPIFHPPGGGRPRNPVVIGHRGLGSGTVRNHQENSLDSCLAAVAHGAAWVEVDARRTADDHLAIHHNPTTPDGAFIVEQTAATVSAKGVALLSDILSALPEQVGINVDVKTELEDAIAEGERRTGALLAPVLGAESHRRPLFVSSFDPAVLLSLRDSVPDVPLGLLTWVDFPLRHAVPAAVHLGLQAIGLHVGSFGPNRVESRPEVHRTPEYSVGVAHQAGLEVLAWCPDPATAVRFAAAGVDAVCVNDVPGALAALADVEP